MFTPREKFIIKLFDSLQQRVADTCDSMLSDEKREAKSSLNELFMQVDMLRQLTTEDDEF